MPYEFLGSVSGNRSPLKGMRRLPRVRPLDRSVIILLVLELTVVNLSFNFLKVSSGYKLVVLRNCDIMIPILNNCLIL